MGEDQQRERAASRWRVRDRAAAVPRGSGRWRWYGAFAVVYLLDLVGVRLV